MKLGGLESRDMKAAQTQILQKVFFIFCCSLKTQTNPTTFHTELLNEQSAPGPGARIPNEEIAVAGQDQPVSPGLC